MKLVAIVGLPGSGKTEVAKILNKKGYSIVRFGDVTDVELKKQGLEINEENGEVRLGKIIHALIQQRYTKPEVVRLLGMEKAEDISSFDEVVKEEEIPIYGKRYRRIPTSFAIKESKAGKYLTKEDHGAHSFLAKPETIRTSEMDIQVISTRRAGQIQAIEFEKANRAIQLYIQLVQLTIPGPNGEAPPLSKDDLPNLELMIEKMVRSMGLPVEQAIGQGTPKTEKETRTTEVVESYRRRKPLDAGLEAGLTAALPPAAPPA